MGKINRHSTLFLTAVIVLVVAGILVVPGLRNRGRRLHTSYLPASLTVQAAEVNPWTQAVTRIKEDRGEPTGKQAKVDIPQELRHYSDTRRFLAIQVAEVRERRIRTPRDLVDLGEMIRRGEMVAIQPVNENYVLFGVGAGAGKEPITKFENGTSIPLFNAEGLKRQYGQLSESRSRYEIEIAAYKKELSALGKRERSKRTSLQSKIAGLEKELNEARESKTSLDRFYGDTAKSSELFAGYESLSSLSKNLPGRDFNLEDGSARRDFKVRLLSSMRPEAFKVMEEIAIAYRENFGRPLPITSLVRPDEYQNQLSKTNPNATRIQTPPHSTGLAFDIYYRYMTAAEQAHVMSHLAHLKNEGRIEVLRENRDHYHVFAFVDGAKPGETFINASMNLPTRPKAVQLTNHTSKSGKLKKKPQPAKQRGATGRRR